MTPTKFYFVYRQHPRNTFGVYVQPGEDGTGQSLVEGGFFSKAAALDARYQWEQEHLAEVKEAHR